MPNELATLERQSVQEHEPKTSVGATNIWFHIPGVDALDGAELLPQYGQHWRDRRLRLLYRGPYAWIAQSAVASLVRRVKQAPWQMEAGPRIRTYYQHLLQDAEFGEGWGAFISKVLLDFLTCDYGAYVEVIAPGKPTGPIRGRVTGLAHLDSLRCVPTGNLEFPVVYWSRVTGKMHRLHHERVIRLVDMPDGDEKLFGPGLCALSRAVSVLAVQEKMQRYVTGALDDIPAAGVFYNKGMADSQWQAAYQEYRLKRQGGYKGIMTISDTNPNIGGEFVGFSMAPDGFDYAQYTELAVNAFAAAFGIDRQDLWPLTGKMSGTATQSEILMEKARGMAFGDILQMLERAINLRVLPPAAEFQFAVRDEESELVVAQRTSVVVGNANALSSYLSSEEIRRYLANQSEELRDILTDEEGNIVELPDDDRRDEDDDATVTDVETEAETDEDSTPQEDDENIGRKQIQAVRLDFEDAFADMLQAIRDGEVNRRRAGVLLRGLINREGRRAYVDGLIDGGVTDGTLDDTDRDRLALLTAQQSQYVTAFLDKVADTPLTDAQAALKPAQWYGGSIQPFYDAGRLSADANGNYECVGPVDDHSCATCATAAGQIHRLKDWTRANLLFPHGSGIICSPGKLCRHTLTRTNQGARGRLSAIPRAGIKSARYKYDPNQPRDTRGRWTDTGGGIIDSLSSMTGHQVDDLTELVNDGDIEGLSDALRDDPKIERLIKAHNTGDITALNDLPEEAIEATRETLRRKYGNTITLFHGSDQKISTNLDWRENSSFTDEFDLEFAGEEGYIVEVKVPVERVKFFLREEREFVITGGNLEGAEVTTVRDYFGLGDEDFQEFYE